MNALDYLGSLFGSGVQPSTQRQADARNGALALTAGAGMTAMMVSAVVFPPLGLALGGAFFVSGMASLGYASETEEINYDKNIANKKFVVGFAEGTTSGLVPFSNPILNSSVQSAARSVVGNILPEVIDNKPLTVKKVGESMVEAAVDGAIGAITTTVFYGVREAYIDAPEGAYRMGPRNLNEIDIDTVGCVAAGAVASAANNSMIQLKQGKNFESTQVFNAAMLGGFFGLLLAEIERALDSDIQLNKQEIASITIKLKGLKGRAKSIEDSIPRLAFNSAYFNYKGLHVRGLKDVLWWAARNGNYVVQNPRGQGYFGGNGTPVTFANLDEIEYWITGNHGGNHGIVLKSTDCVCCSDNPQYIYIDGGFIDKAYYDLNKIAEEIKELLYSFPYDLQDMIYNAIYPIKH